MAESQENKEENSTEEYQKLIQSRFWESKSLSEMTQSEWESICDGCGKCCFLKYSEGHFKRKKTYFTRLACNYLDLQNCCCSVYKNRFDFQKACIRLTNKNLSKFKWLPSTCSYRYFLKNKKLPPFHPLLNGGSKDKVPKIENPLHESQANIEERGLMEYVFEIE